jgi:flagellar hook-associated protein 2
MAIAPITFTGLASGIDTASLVKQLVAVESQPITRLQTKQASLNSVSSKLNNIKSLLATLQQKAQALDARDEVTVSSATSNQESAVLATTNGQAVTGNHDVTVTTLATAARANSNGFTSKSATGLFDTNLTSISLQVGSGTTKTFTINKDTTTLESLASDINTSGLRVTAGVIFDGTNYRLQISGLDTGSANVLHIVETGGTMGLLASENQPQEAGNAVFTIDKLLMGSSTNTVTDAIPGVTLQFKKLTTGTAQIAVQGDATALQTKVQEFVTAYNAVMSAINTEFTYSGKPNTTNSLSGDSTLRNLQQSLMKGISDGVAGLSAPYDRLSGVGIATQKDGTLTLDTNKLNAAVKDNSEAVANLFSNNVTNKTTGAMARMSTVIDGYIGGSSSALAVKIANIATRVKDMDTQIDRMETRVGKYEETLQARFAALESLVSSLKNQGSQMESIMGSLNSSK